MFCLMHMFAKGMSDSRVSATMSAEDWDNAAVSYTMVDGELTPNPEQDQLP